MEMTVSHETVFLFYCACGGGNRMKKYVNYLKTSIFAKITLALLLIVLILGCFLFWQSFIFLPTRFFLIALVAFILIVAILWILHYKIAIVCAILEVLLCICMVIGLMAIHRVNTFADKVTDVKEVEVVEIVALKDADITEEDAFDQYILAYSQDDDQAYERSAECLEENGKTVAKEKPYQNMEKAYAALKDQKVELLVLTSIGRSDLSMIDENYDQNIKVILSKEYEVETAKSKNVDISTEPFTIYLQGTDLSSGSNINSTGRGDVNILLTINPNTKQVNMQVIPRDLFVYIPCRGGSSKLSYSGWWGGVQSSIASIEDALDIEINYYVKINFDGLIDLVDALGGVEVYSYYTYYAGGYQFVEGYNQVDGEKALMFARARKMLPLNERSRGYQQMELIKAIFTKFAQEPSFDHAMSVIDSLENNFTTNLPKEDFKKAYQLVVELLPQLQTMEDHSIEGEYEWHYDEVRPTYYQYYFYPAEGELEAVKERIDAILAD